MYLRANELVEINKLRYRVNKWMGAIPSYEFICVSEGHSYIVTKTPEQVDVLIIENKIKIIL